MKQNKSMKQLLEHIKKLEKNNYPEFMQYFQNINNWKSFCDYCEYENPVLYYTDKSYLIMTYNEIVDLIAAPQDIFLIYKCIRKYFGHRIIEGDFRYKTSYSIIKLFENKNKIKIFSKNKWYWEYERMIKIKFQIT